MPREYKRPSIVSGKSVKDILGMSMSTFTLLKLPDLREVVGRLVSAANKRLRTFARAGEQSPASRKVEQSGGLFSTRNKNLNQLRAEYVRAKKFLQSETGTVKGWRKVRAESIKELAKRGIVIDAAGYDAMWKAYERLKEVSPEVSNRQFKYKILTNAASMVIEGRKTTDEIAADLRKQLTRIYEEQAEEQANVDGVSGFFELE